MNNKQGNPFLNTKALFLDDNQILEYWTDITKIAGGFKNMLKPKDMTPIYILGGKGSGKTHIMRYFSYKLQLLRSSGNINTVLENEKYIGIYSLFNGLNYSRFKDKGISEIIWMPIFEYYFELWLTSELLVIVTDLITKLNNVDEKKICSEIIKLFDIKVKRKIINLKNLQIFISELISKVNVAVNNARPKSVEIIVSRGNLIFGIPNILTNKIPQLKDVNFLYLLDELEKLEEYQQKYINTLIWERKDPCSFRIGSRLYGFKTDETYNANEKIRKGSEYKEIILDNELRKDEQKYIRFAKILCLKRLHANGYIPSDNINNLKQLDNYFDKYIENDFISLISNKYKSKELPYITQLRQQIYKYINLKITKTDKENVIEEIILNLKAPKNLLHEKLKILSFYIQWNQQKGNLLKISRIVKNEYNEYIKNISKNTKFKRFIEHYKNDMLAQLQHATREKVLYTGLNTFIELSWGIPRNLIIILNEIYEKAVFNCEKPFIEENKISLESQNSGVIIGAKWFEDNININGSNSEYVRQSLLKIVSFLRDVRFSYKPSECSISSFSVNIEDLSRNSKDTLKTMSQHSVLVQFRFRKNKNREKIKSAFQINRMLAPLWELPISRRGVLHLNKDLANSIFDYEQMHKHEEIRNEFLRLLKPPFGKDFEKSDYYQLTFPGF